MGNLIIKGKGGAGNKLILQDQAGAAVLTTADSGATFSGGNIGTVTAGTLASGVTGGSGLDGRSWVKLQETVASNDATITMGSSSIFSSTYDLYIITITGLKPVTAGTDLRAKYYLGGSLIGSNYRWSNIAHVYATELYRSEASEAYISIAGSINTGLESSNDICLNGEIYVYDPSNTDLLTQIKGHLFHFNNSNQPQLVHVGGTNNSGSGAAEPALTGLQFYMSSGNINAGKFIVYGVKN